MEPWEELWQNPEAVESGETTPHLLAGCLRYHRLDHAQRLVRALFTTRTQQTPVAFKLLLAYLRRFREASFSDVFEQWRPGFVESFRQAALTEARAALQDEFEFEVFPYLVDPSSLDQAASQLIELARRFFLVDMLPFQPDLRVSMALPEEAGRRPWETVDWDRFAGALNRAMAWQKGTDLPSGSVLLELAQNYTEAVSADFRRYRVRALFVRGVRGEVRDIWVSVWEDPEKKGGPVPDPSWQVRPDFEAALKNGYLAAHGYLDRLGDSRRFLVRPLFEGELRSVPLEGPSIGLAMAVAIIARAQGLQVNPALAVTGAIDENGAVHRVGEIDRKIEAVREHNRQAPHDLIEGVIVPRENERSEPRIHPFDPLNLVAVASLDQVIESGLLIDPWEPYLEELGRLPKDGLSEALAERALEGLAWQAPERPWTLLVCQYNQDARRPLEALASWSADRRRVDGRKTPLPLLLNLRDLDRPLFPFLRDQLQDKVKAYPQVGSNLLLQPLQGGTLLLLGGADGLPCSRNWERNDPLPSLVKALMNLRRSVPRSAQNPVVFACNEATAEALKAILNKDYGVRPNVIRLYDGRSNFLDGHLDQERQGAEKRILACQGGVPGSDRDCPTAEEFFYGSDPTPSLYIEVRVRGERGKGELRRLEEVILEGDNDPPARRRLLLLGDGGAGKSTELLRLFFDCVAPRSPSPLKGRFTPWLIRLNRLPGRWKRGSEEISLDEFLEWLRRDFPWEGLSLERFRTEIQWTPLLLLMDGLDEIHPDTPEARDAIGNILEEFVQLCHPKTWMVVACRDKERERGMQHSLLECDLFATWRPFILEELTVAQIEAYPRRAGRFPEEARTLLEILRSQPGILRSPMLLYLSTTAAPAKLGREPLVPARLYRAVMQTWLEREMAKKMGKIPFAFARKPAEDEDAVKLVGVLAEKMVEADRDCLTEPEAREALSEYIRNHPQKPDWWPIVKGKEGVRGFGYDASGGGVNKIEVHQLMEILKELCIFPRITEREFTFLHDSLRDYFCAEALGGLCDEGLGLDAPSERRAAASHELGCLTKEEEYQKWGPILRLLPDLIDNRTVLQGLIDWCRNWQENLFGLDCLPRLYHRVYKLAAHRPPPEDDGAEALFDLMENGEFLERKLGHPLFRDLLLDDLRLALGVALDRFCPENRPTDLRALPKVVRFGLYLPLVWTHYISRGMEIVGLASSGRYPEALRRVYLIGEGHGQTRYALLLLIGWIATRKARECRGAQDPGRTRYHRQMAEQALDEALGIDPKESFINYWWEGLILVMAQDLLGEGLTDQAIGVIERFGREISPSSSRVGIRDDDMSDQQERHHACHYLIRLARLEDLERDLRLRLLDRARAMAMENALHSPDYPWDEEFSWEFWTEAKYGDPVVTAALYADLGRPERAREIYEGLPEEWIRDWGTVYRSDLLEMELIKDEEKIGALDLLLDGLERLPGASWVAGWCRQLRARVEPLPSAEQQPEIWARLARACLIAGDPGEAESLLARAVETLEREMAPGATATAIEYISGLLARMDGRRGAQYLPRLIRCAHEGIVALLGEIESGRACRRTGEEGLESLILGECACIRELAGLPGSRIDEERERIAESMRAIDGCRADRSRSWILLRMGLHLYEMGEVELAREAMAPGVSARIKGFTLEDWRGNLPELRRRSPAFWATCTEVRDAIDRLIGEHHEKYRREERKISEEWDEGTVSAEAERLLGAGQLLKAAKLFEEWMVGKEREALPHWEYEGGGWLPALAAGLQGRYPDAAIQVIRKRKAGELSSVVEALCQRGEPVHNAMVEELTSMIRKTEPLQRDLFLALARLCLRWQMRSQAARLLDLALEGIEEGFPQRADSRIISGSSFDSELLDLADDAQELAPDLAWRALEKASLFPGLAPFLPGVAGRLCRWGRMENGLELFRRFLEGTGKSLEQERWAEKSGTAPYRWVTLRAMVALELWRSEQEAWAQEVIVPLRCDLERLWKEAEDLASERWQGAEFGQKTPEWFKRWEMPLLKHPFLAVADALAEMGDQEVAGELRRKARELEELRHGRHPVQQWDWADALHRREAREAEADPEERRRQLADRLRSLRADALTEVNGILAELIRLCEDPQILLEIFNNELLE